MKKLLFSLLVLGLGALVAPVSARADDGEFTVADVRGSYGFSWDGTIVPPRREARFQLLQWGCWSLMGKETSPSRCES
jgi:hypothetical protein